MSYDGIEPFITKDGDLVTRDQFDVAAKDNPLAKLLFSTLWKNGDLKKIKHIIKGMRDVYEQEDIRHGNGNGGWVFYQFGRHLANRGEPIVDQHTIRAFKILTKLGTNWNNTNPTVTRDELIAYREWLFNINFRTDQRSDCQMVLDKVLFTVGKAAKRANDLTFQ